MDSRKRIHIGNISPGLAEKKDDLTRRLAKFGTVCTPLELHTKPINDFYFAYIDMDISDESFKKLKAGLNGVLFMGRKISIAEAKKSHDSESDRNRPEPSKRELAKRSGIALARSLRLQESRTALKLNTYTHAPLIRSFISANNSSMGYTKSAHTFQNISANTKHLSPSHSLVGAKSYGSTLVPKGPYRQQISKTSGGSEVIRGRLRKTPRPASHMIRREQSLRILINGELKQIKAYKTKLWGIEKKAASELTFAYADGAWWSGDNHVVERVSQARQSCGISGADAENYGKDARESQQTETQIQANEQSSTASVLAKMFQTFDFDKKVDLDEADDGDEPVSYDSKGRKVIERFDFEKEGTLEEHDTGYEEANMDVVDSYIKSAERPQEEVYFSESDEGNQLDMEELQSQYTEAIKEQYDQEHEATTNPDQEIETGDLADETTTNEVLSELDPSVAHEQKTQKDTKSTAVTEHLRSVFNLGKEPSDGFSFGLDLDDVDEEKFEQEEKERQLLLQQIKEKQKQQEERFESQAVRRKFGLFWTHSDSPFLQTQTQLSKVGFIGEAFKLPGEEDEEGGEPAAPEEGQEDAYEKWFWSVRGDMNRECKRRRRDVMRTIKKKSNRAFL